MRFVLFLSLLTAFVPGSAETRPRPSADLSSEVFSEGSDSKATVRRTIRASGKIFAGTVIRVEHADPAPISGISITQITFRAEEARRGGRVPQPGTALRPATSLPTHVLEQLARDSLLELLPLREM